MLLLNTSFALCHKCGRSERLGMTSNCGRLSKILDRMLKTLETHTETNFKFFCLTRRSGTGWRITLMSLPCFTSGHRQIWQVHMEWRHLPSVFWFSLLDSWSLPCVAAAAKPILPLFGGGRGFCFLRTQRSKASPSCLLSILVYHLLESLLGSFGGYPWCPPSLHPSALKGSAKKLFHQLRQAP